MKTKTKKSLSLKVERVRGAEMGEEGRKEGKKEGGREGGRKGGREMVEAFYCWLFMMSCPRDSEGLKVLSLQLNLLSLWTQRTAEPNRTDHPVDKKYEP